MPLRFFTGRTVAAMLRDAADAKHLDDDGRAAAVSEALRTLAALPRRKRERAAHDIDVGGIVDSLGVASVPLWRALLDDEFTREVVGSDAIHAWLRVDEAGCATYAVAHLDDWEAPLALQILSCIDAAEAYELLAPRVERDAGLRRFIVDAGSESIGVFADGRWVDVALGLLSRDGAVAVEILRLNGSPRADEELDGILQRAVAVDELVLATLEAFEAGTGLLAHDEVRPRFLTTLTRFLAGAGAEGIEASRFSFNVTIAARELLARDDLTAAARRRIDACLRAHPYLVRG